MRLLWRRDDHAFELLICFVVLGCAPSVLFEITAIVSSAEDAVCSPSDQGHDSLLALFAQRFSQQIEVADTQTILTAWV
jgi:hypothetical protein